MINLSVHAVSPTAIVELMWRNRWLTFQMAQREVVGRYRGSMMGLLWSFLSPLLMLAVYTFVFSVVFQVRWGEGREQTNVQFAVVLFAGLIAHSLLAEVLNRAPGLVVSNANYVKRVIFPLEILPLVTTCAAMFHALVSLIVLLAAMVTVSGVLPWTFILAPIVFLPLAIMALGAAWGLAAFGVYLRDIGHTVALVTTALLFLSPIFFPLEALPEAYRGLIAFNPLTFIVEEARKVLIWGELPDWFGLARYTLIACIVAWIGFMCFSKLKRGFADVL
jgi:lipopolysaccharide transport system permease protein